MESQSEILDLETHIESDVEEQSIIGLWQFMVLTIVTFGIYEIWWMYKSWRFFKQKNKEDISPVGRAIFSLFYLHALMSRILDYAKTKGYTGSFPTTGLFVGFIIFNFCSHLPVPYGLISIVGFVFLIPPFLALNYAKMNSTEFKVTIQSFFNLKQIALLIVGSIIWILAIIGLNADKFNSEF